MTYREAMNASSRALIERVLRRHQGSRAKTARELALTRQGLWALMRRHKITVPSRAPQVIGQRRAAARRAGMSENERLCVYETDPSREPLGSPTKW